MRLFRRASLIATSLVAVAALEVGLSLPGWTQQKDLVDTAVSAGSFNTLAKALAEAGLVETPRGSGPFTVFAPTDEAFAKLPPGTLEALLKNTDKLRAVLTYHVVAGKLMAVRIVNMNALRHRPPPAWPPAP